MTGRRHIFLRALAATLSLACLPMAFAENRFPKPDFETDYVFQDIEAPAARADMMQWVDVAALFIALSLASYFILKRRSRRAVFILMLCSLAYFGFYREGCICPIGSIQNVAMALFNADYAVPISVIIFFALPLFFSLLFGRAFCAGVCPLGAIQDVMVYKPIKIPRPLAAVLSTIPYIYLGTAVLFAAAGSAFLICRYDPFVAFFRLTGSFGMLMFGGILLLIGMFIARPYCRFLCPYGVLLNWTSRFSWKHLQITPDTCIQCRLCEEACPFDCIKKPTAMAEAEQRPSGKHRLRTLLILLPVLVAGFSWIGSRFHLPLATIDREVALAEQLAREASGTTGESTLHSDAFRETNRTPDELFAEVRQKQEQFRQRGWMLGGFIGLVLGGTLISNSIKRTRPDYTADRATCFSCARCYNSCSREHLRLGLIDEFDPQFDPRSPSS